MHSNRPTPEQIIPLLEQILQQQPDGLSEYELLILLAEQHSFFADYRHQNHSPDNNEPSQDLNLFQRHFLLFHCLYRLEQKYQENESNLLTISALDIRLVAYHSAGKDKLQGLATADPIRDYYLDITQLESTGEDEIDEMLGKFWLAFTRQDTRTKALSLLGLSDPVDNITIRKCYREKAMQHHPDRGGDLETIQQLNAAISELLPKSP